MTDELECNPPQKFSDLAFSFKDKAGQEKQTNQKILRILDLYCGAGGACKGLQNLGFEVISKDENRVGIITWGVVS